MQNPENYQFVTTTKEQLDRNKLIVLNKFYANHSVLWPKARQTESRQNAWIRINKELVAEGCTDFANKDWRYLRAITWKNWKKRFLLKAEKMRQTNNENYSNVSLWVC